MNDRMRKANPHSGSRRRKEAELRANSNPSARQGTKVKRPRGTSGVEWVATASWSAAVLCRFRSFPVCARLRSLALIALPLFAVMSWAIADSGVPSPDGSVGFKFFLNQGKLSYSISCRNKSIIEPSPMEFTVDGVDLTQGAELQRLQPYDINESYPWRGVHSVATNHCNGIKIELLHTQSKSAYTLDVRVFNDAAAFRFLVPATNQLRVPDEASTFLIPAHSTVWYHDLEGHYEGVHVKKEISAITASQWLAPPVTFKLPDGLGYASITEAALTDYAGMALQADGARGLRVRLGHSHPPSHPYLLRYGTNEAQRLSKPAAIMGAITTPWRVVMLAPDLNGLVNCDAVHNLCPPPNPRFFPKGLHTDWIRPGRAVWKYLDGGGSNSLATAREFTRMAGELGFEHNIVEGYWSRWSDADIKDLVQYGNSKHVGIWGWKHSRDLRTPEARHDFFKRCHEVGLVGAKIDFFDHEAKELVDLYDALLSEAAEYHLLLDFHGANKPTGLSRTWPNELTREAVRGMEASRLQDRATHDVTLPFTRFLAGPAEYTPMIFNQRRANTTWAHQIASPVIFTTPLLTYAANPSNILANPCCDMIKSIPSVWDETIVLPPSEIGEIAVFARRTGKTWFLAIMNGTEARKIKIPLSFLGKEDYRASLVRDNQDGTAAQTDLSTSLRSSNSLTVDLHQGGGFVARFSK
jgi:alpha-glucosidase